MAISLTAAAASHIEQYLSRRGKGIGLRLGVKTTGCSGLAYKLEYADSLNPEDVVFESNGIKVMVDPKKEKSLGPAAAGALTMRAAPRTATAHADCFQ